MAPSAKELFAVAQSGQSIEDQLALLAPVEHVQPRDEEWAEAMASLVWMYRATNQEDHALRCANLVVSTQPHGLVWREQCVVLRSNIAIRNRDPVDTAEVIHAVKILATAGELEAASEGADVLTDAYCAAKQFVEAEYFAREELNYVQRMRSEYHFDDYCFPPVARCLQTIAWIQAAAGQHEAARQTLALALDELAQPGKPGQGGTMQLLRRRVQERLNALNSPA